MKQRTIKIQLMLVLISLSMGLFINASSIKANSGSFIEGFAKWQADRVEKIILDQAIFSLIENEYVKAFFPETTLAVSSYGGNTSAQRLIPLIQVMIENDIKDIEKTFTIDIKSFLDTTARQFRENKISLALQNVQRLEQALRYTGDGDAITIISWYENFKSVVSDGPCIGITRENNCPLDPDNKGNLSVLYKIKTQTNRTFNEILSKSESESITNIVNTTLKNLPGYTNGKNNDDVYEYNLLIARINKMISLIQQYQELERKYDNEDGKKSIIAIHFFIRFFELFGAEDQNYTNFKSLGLFLAALVEAEDSDAIAAVLDSFIDEKTAYYNKRLDANNTIKSWFKLPAYNTNTKMIELTPYTGTCYFCQNTLFLGSYFGAALTRLPDEETFDKELQARAFGPVGLEYKIFSHYGNPITLNFAPIDIGNYISNELRDVDYTARFSDIIAPSVFVSYTFNKRPFSILIGHQKDVRVGNDIEEDTFFISFAIDLPIYTIY